MSAHAVDSRSPEDTAALAARLAAACPPGMTVHLHGDLGAGKSTFARAFLQALGVRGAIKSPTYTLIETYTLADGLDAVHMDLYRIAAPDEVDYLSLDDYDGRSRVMLVEWPERGEGHVPGADLRIEIDGAGDARRLLLHARTAQGRDWLAASGLNGV